MTKWFRLISAACVIPFLVTTTTSTFAASSLDAGIQELSGGIVPFAQKLAQRRIAVVDFSDLQGRVTVLGRFIAEELSAALVLSGGGIRVVDRQHLARIIQEQKLAIYGITDPQAVKRLGQMAGADALVVGSITDLGDRVRITAKMLSTSTADIVGAAQTSVPKSGEVERLLQQGAVVQASPSSPRPTSTTGRFIALSELTPVLGRPSFERVTLFARRFTGFVAPCGISVVYNLNRQFRRFMATVGVADNAPHGGAVFKVLGDGRLLFESPRMNPGDVPVDVDVPVEGVLRFALAYDSGVCLEAVWAEPRLLK